MSAVTGFSAGATVVALDTSGPIGSVVVCSGGDVVSRAVLTRRAEHASGLIPAIAAVLEEGGVDRLALHGIVVGEGPGSFTGVRVGAATAKGFSRALDIPLWTISSLAAAAMAVESGVVRYALFDARAERVYGACYGIGGSTIQTVVPPHAGDLRDVLAGDVPGGAVFVGEAAERHRAAIEGAGFEVVSASDDITLADGLIRYLAIVPDVLPIADVRGWEPAYVRASNVKRPWTR